MNKKIDSIKREIHGFPLFVFLQVAVLSASTCLASQENME